ncbi:MAG: GTP-binding protein, partial [Ligilactobacillus agilis]|nr:GTP-binding protein [Ligilactobacillus agilis]
MKEIVTGIIANVDAGKTTLSEALLYETGALRNLGRVDKGDAHLDTASLEKQRGITIFSHQTKLTTGNTSLNLLDTPGHLDFIEETEAVLAV